jgi:hypothetical protein
MVKSGSVDEAAYKALPAAPSGPLTFPTEAQITQAEATVAQGWTSAIGG